MNDTSEGVTVEIYDQPYHLRGQDPAYIERLANLVDTKMRAVAAQGTTVDSLRVAVLAAINIADEYMTLQARHRALTVAESGRDHAAHPRQQPERPARFGPHRRAPYRLVRSRYCQARCHPKHGEDGFPAVASSAYPLLCLPLDRRNPDVSSEVCTLSGVPPPFREASVQVVAAALVVIHGQRTLQSTCPSLVVISRSAASVDGTWTLTLPV